MHRKEADPTNTIGRSKQLFAHKGDFRMKSMIFAHGYRVVLVFVVALTMMIVVQPPRAHADANGHTTWGGFTISVGVPGASTSVKIPKGVLNAGVEGKGQSVDKITASFRAATNGICNWHIAARFYDRNGSEYQTMNSRDHGSCDFKGEWNQSANYRAQPGRVCIGLYTHFSQEVAKVCHAILPSTPASPPSAANCAYSWTRNLAVGARGADVAELQNRLNARGARLAADGIFGPMTKQTVVNFQSANRLAADGIVGPKTQAVLNTICR